MKCTAKESKAHAVYGYVRCESLTRGYENVARGATAEHAPETDLILSSRSCPERRASPTAWDSRPRRGDRPGPTTRRIVDRFRARRSRRSAARRGGPTWARLVLAVFVTPGPGNYQSSTLRQGAWQQQRVQVQDTAARGRAPKFLVQDLPVGSSFKVVARSACRAHCRCQRRRGARPVTWVRLLRTIHPCTIAARLRGGRIRRAHQRRSPAAPTSKLRRPYKNGRQKCAQLTSTITHEKGRLQKFCGCAPPRAVPEVEQPQTNDLVSLKPQNTSSFSKSSRLSGALPVRVNQEGSAIAAWSRAVSH